MTLLYYDPRFLNHQTGAHPENAKRLIQVWRQLERTGLDQQCKRHDWLPASDATLELVHDGQYLQALDAYQAAGGGQIEEDTVVSPQSVNVARLAAGAVVDAVQRVVGGEDQTALCLVRPPGHHALPHAPMGFCLLNNIAIGAIVATRQLQMDRVLIIDWDVHHGNGTQDAFYEDERVAVLSVHRSPFYPGTGAADETGRGAGLGANLNLPMRFGISRDEYIDAFRQAVESFADRVRPQLVLISAGFDSHRDDPVGSLGLETEDFDELTSIVRDVAQAHAAGRVVSVLEGGYNPGILAGCVEIHLQRLLAGN